MVSGFESDALSGGGSSIDGRQVPDVVMVLLRLDALRDRGFTSEEIAATMAESNTAVPTGGSWDASVVDRLLAALQQQRAAEQSHHAVPAAIGSETISAAAVTETIPPPAAMSSNLLDEDPPGYELPSSGHQDRDHQPGTLAGSLADGGIPARFLQGALALAAVGFAAVAVYTGLNDDDSTTAANTLSSKVTVSDDDGGSSGIDTGSDTGEVSNGEVSNGEVSNGEVSNGEGSNGGSGDAADAGIPIAPDTESVDPADMMSIRVDPEEQAAADGAIAAATATVKADGLLHLEGAFPSQGEADRYVDGVAKVFGRDNIVESYVINAAAPLPTVSDVALDKPVLFETGTAVIDPSYIPFLEACGDVLKLNPHITMSITAFTDSTGSDALNLELSRQRAQAIYDFYRELEIDDTQLLSFGYGEADPVADNETEEGRQQNRRAMLQLLDVMADEAQPEDS